MTWSLGSGPLRVVVSAYGAELQSITADGRELLWQGGPAWPRRSPVLFPVVGRLAGGVLRVDGREHLMNQHGFARDRVFRCVESGPDVLELELTDDRETRAAYPFAFRLALRYEVSDEVSDVLRVTYLLSNTGQRPLPASVGAHPAFAWPLVPGTAKDAHAVVLEHDEPAPVRRLEGGLLDPVRRPSPVVGSRLALSEELFADDAVILDALTSRALRYSGPGGPELAVSWEGFTWLGLWSAPGGDFVCLEPWQGHADPVGFTGDVSERSGGMLLAPGERRELAWALAVRG